MGIIRFAVAVFVVMALFSLAGSMLGGVAAGAATFGALALIPFLILKGVFLFMILGVVGRRAFAPRGDVRPPWRRSDAPDRPSDEERFEEWHRMAHARQEVDSWTPEL